MKYKIIVAYDGTRYAGWQKQPGLPTIQGTLEETFKRVFNQEVRILGASRTDAGVHANGQVSSFLTDLVVEPSKILFALNNVLPASIQISNVEQVPDDYTPHHGVTNKTYYYHFFLEKPSPFVARYGWYYRKQIDFEKLHDVLQVFVGTHDFRSFSTGYDREDTVRTITSMHVEQAPELQAYRIVVNGPKFLHHMVRRIVGACLQVASRDSLTIKDLQDALAEKSPAQTLPSAPALGLMLHHITYE